MVSGKRISGADLKNRKKTKFKRLYCLFAGLVAAILLFALLLLYEPTVFKPPNTIDDNQVSVYLTHVLLPQLYNGAQRAEPFDLIVTQKGINDVIARSNWPRQAGGIRFLAPAVFFVPDTIVLMGQACAGGVEFVVTVIGKPRLDEVGLLNLRVEKVKLGAVAIRPFAAMIARKIYSQNRCDSDADTLSNRIAASLLDGEPFEPIFEIDDKKVRISKITIVQKKLTVHFVPAI
jgi:hypothetical protein